ncbi:MAG: VCBS repeat-containing protein, partial [Gemmatimonadota bacterium]|nr:VCBS repeat-containing protein [Gemmatimonadota bacterium]
TGEAQVWLMSGTSRIGRANIADAGRPTLIGPPWRIVGSRDFNRDGRTDILWHNSSTSAIQIWYMNGHNVNSRATVLGEGGNPALVGSPWSIVGANDMNGDGKSDIVWHNSSSGETQIWHVDGHRVLGRATVLGENGIAAAVGAPWSIVGTGDFSGDRKPDLLWHNSSSGESQVWKLDGYKVTGRATVLGENGTAIEVGLPWRITGTNDFDQSGSADILWHNGSTGHSQVWHMTANRVIGRATVDAVRDGGGSEVRLPWSIVSH